MSFIYNRRNFLKFMGTTPFLSSLTSCNNPTEKKTTKVQLPFKSLAPQVTDSVLLASGLHYEVLIKESDVIKDNLYFGTQNDFTLFIPLKGNPLDGLLWINHESFDRQMLHAEMSSVKTEEEKILFEMAQVGGSLIRIKFDQKLNRWKFIEGDGFNRRFDARSIFKLISPRAIKDKTFAIGTFANCSGGYTPWGSILSCEENYDQFVGDQYVAAGVSKKTLSTFGWEKHFEMPSEHYGWVVEINPYSGEGKKLTALGRFAHENACVIQSSAGIPVVYMGDDVAGGCIYKFVSKSKKSLHKGTLYVADVKNGIWVALERNSNPRLKQRFNDQTDLLVNCREAAVIAGGTPMDRPEDIEFHDKSQTLLIALTNNKKTDNYYGSLFRISENNNDPLGTKFTSDTFLHGGEESGFACADNLIFDPKGNLWLTSDISKPGRAEGKYKNFGNNSLFYIPMSGSHAGTVSRVAIAPIGAEFSGPSFTPDGKTLFLSVQHPGKYIKESGTYTSSWPRGKGTKPLSAVISISGPVLEKLMS